ncbi:putative short-chain dehydrogenase [Diaporthe sp. PMI_573]|nr:putative short-chain dehydrogenase [Diaporthaceae sp. PMI_573]
MAGNTEVAPKGTVLLTGANGGLGVAMVKKIVLRPDLANLHGIYLLEDVRKVAADINVRVASGEVPLIHALILNAAYLEFGQQTWTADGFDNTFASAYLGHWLLTMLLLQSLDRQHGRIVVLASSTHDSQDKRNDAGGQYLGEKWQTIFHDNTEPIARGTWSTTKEDPSFRGGFRRYGAAKLCQVMMMPELQRRIDLDPVLSNISKSSGGLIAAAFDSNPTLGERPKGMYLDGEERREMAAEARDPKKREILWRDTIIYTGLKKDETILANWA